MGNLTICASATAEIRSYIQPDTIHPYGGTSGRKLYRFSELYCSFSDENILNLETTLQVIMY